MGKKRLRIKTDCYKELRNELESTVKSKYQSLQLIVENDVLFLRGIFPLIDFGSGEEIDSYEIEMEFPRNYPSDIPIVRETGGRIPRKIDRHIDEKTGNACLGIREQLHNNITHNASALSFIEGPIYEFFLGQSYYELTEKWIFGEWSHGAKGILEYYSKILKTNDPKIILTFVEYLSKNTVKGHWPCYCANGKRLRNCHFKFLLLARNVIPSDIAKKSYYELKSLFDLTK